MQYLNDDSKDWYEAVGEAKLGKICDISLSIIISGGLYLIPKRSVCTQNLYFSSPIYF